MAAVVQRPIATWISGNSYSMNLLSFKNGQAARLIRLIYSKCSPIPKRGSLCCYQWWADQDVQPKVQLAIVGRGFFQIYCPECQSLLSTFRDGGKKTVFSLGRNFSKGDIHVWLQHRIAAVRIETVTSGSAVTNRLINGGAAPPVVWCSRR
jgi:hypothetical protein